MTQNVIMLAQMNIGVSLLAPESCIEPWAIEPLMAETILNSHVTGSAIRSLSYFNDERSAQCLIELIRTNDSSAGVPVLSVMLFKTVDITDSPAERSGV